MSFRRILKNTEVEVILGDITDLDVDAIVNPANSKLIMGGGVAGAILRAGGKQIQNEALGKAPVSIGKAVSTTGGKLKAKYVIHAPTMSRPAMSIGKENASRATKAALECAEELNIKSIAFPGLGTGVGGLKAAEAAHAMVQEIKKHIEAGTTIHRITLVGFSTDLAQAFKQEIESMP
jgi:O-acetyl-ADP-ribose deacetylase (regulator of RNase III)